MKNPKTSKAFDETVIGHAKKLERELTACKADLRRSEALVQAWISDHDAKCAELEHAHTRVKYLEDTLLEAKREAERARKAVSFMQSMGWLLVVGGIIWWLFTLIGGRL